MNRPQFEYQKPKTKTGDLRTPVYFYEFSDDGPEPGESEEKELFFCLAEAYSPSIKDIEKLNKTDTTEAVTIVIRDPHEEYIPNNTHFCKIDDFRYKNKVWNIVDIRPDFTDNRFITILLGVKPNGR